MKTRGVRPFLEFLLMVPGSERRRRLWEIGFYFVRRLPGQGYRTRVVFEFAKPARNRSHTYLSGKKNPPITIAVRTMIFAAEIRIIQKGVLRLNSSNVPFSWEQRLRNEIPRPPSLADPKR